MSRDFSKEHNQNHYRLVNSVNCGLQESILENEAIATNYLLVETKKGSSQYSPSSYFEIMTLALFSRPYLANLDLGFQDRHHQRPVIAG